MVERPVKTPAEQTPKQASNDAAVKAASNRYFEAVRPSLYQGNDALSQKQGELALAAVPTTAAHVIKARDDAAADLTPEQHEAFHAAIAPRVDQDLNWIKGLADAQAKVAQQQQSQRVVTNSAQDAILQYGSPAFGEHMATGLKQIDEQAAAGGWTPEAKIAAETGFISGVHRGVSDSLSVSDPVLAAEHLRVFGDHMTAEDRAAAWRSLQGPLAQTQAVADLDTLAIARSATAPLTPHGDHDGLVRRMLAITPTAAGAGANAPTDLPDMLDRYGGDAAKAWAASEMGADALDALVAKRGTGWFSALPAETRTAVAANMAMLEAVSSPRSAPTPEERARLAAEIEDQPWSDERKQNAYDELNTRVALGARRDKEAQDAAWESGLALADELGAGFISINQLPPAVRDTLAPDALAALTLRADRNVHPMTVAPHGDIAMALNRQASSDPEEFAKQDLRLVQDRMTPGEYEALDRVQKAWNGYPPGAAAVTQQRIAEKMTARGLDSGSATSAAKPLVASDQPGLIEGLSVGSGMPGQAGAALYMAAFNPEDVQSNASAKSSVTTPQSAGDAAGLSGQVKPPASNAIPAAAPQSLSAAAEAKKRGFSAILSGNTATDPNLTNLVKSVRAQNGSNLELRYKRKQRQITEIVEKLRKAKAKGKDAKTISSIEDDLQRKNNLLLAQSGALLPALRQQRLLQQYFVGKDINIIVGNPVEKNGEVAFEDDGRAAFQKGAQPSTYRIRGPNYKFASADDAAFDAIALARAVTGSLNDNDERAGYIVKNTDGTFGYEYPYELSGNATPFPKLYSAGGDAEARVDHTPKNAVALWHLHPVGGSGDNVRNVYFGPGDIKAPWQASRVISATKFDAYLGSSDGGVRVVRDIRSFPMDADGASVPKGKYQRIGPGFLRLR
jgi:hypothetical protein